MLASDLQGGTEVAAADGSASGKASAPQWRRRSALKRGGRPAAEVRPIGVGGARHGRDAEEGEEEWMCWPPGPMR